MMGVDLVGIDGDDGVLRCPGLRPRMWFAILEGLPLGLPPKGVSAKFPPRFARHDVGNADFEITLDDLSAMSGNGDEDDWDEYDDEEVEAMKDITSAASAKSLDEANVYEYPRFIIKDLKKAKRGEKVDILLRALLPMSKIVFANQEADKERARIAVEVRDKREAMKKAKKTKTKQGYYY